jgi:hypothetical protein
MNIDAGFPCPAQSHLGCCGVAGGSLGATEAVGARSAASAAVKYLLRTLRRCGLRMPTPVRC